MRTFDEILTQVLDLLQREGRVSYRALKRRFELDDDYLEDLKAELIDAKHLAVDEDGKVLVWVGEETKEETEKRRIGESERKEVKDFGLRTSDSGLTAAERRQLTVMFCDLVGSTTLSAQLDPEEWRAIVRDYQAACAEVIHRFDGYIAQYLGDGLLIYFGYPRAHEDDAQRAARAGLEIVGTLHEQSIGATAPLRHRETGAQSQWSPLQIRIGIHTGLVVVGEVGEGTKRDQIALGDTPNIAARLQGLAEPDTIVISAATYHLVAGLLDCQDLGFHTVKGLAAPVQVYRVVGESEVRSRLDVAVTAGLTPLVGREEEIGLLLRRWEQVKASEGQVVLLNGEAGIGKSRIVQVLKERVTKENHTWLEARCSPYHQNSAFYPVIDLLQRMLQFGREDSAEEKLSKLEKALSLAGFDPQEMVPFFAALLSLSAPRFPLPELTPQKQREKTFHALLAWWLRAAERQPALSVWEDVHWADPSTLELLSLLLEQVPTTCLFIALTFRPDFTPPWASRSHMTHLTLTRLGRKQVEAMIEQVAGDKTLPIEIVQQVVTKTDGVPLFVEELTKAVMESNPSVGAHSGAPVPSLAIPTTLHDSLMARLDRLGSAKEVAQIGATLGREFSYELLSAISPVIEMNLQHALAKLVDAELLYPRGLPPHVTYMFKHALIQDTAYQSLLKSTRQQYHKKIAEVLEEKFSEVKENQPELVAHHYTEAEFGAHAIPYWQQAGEKAVQRSANVEAISHLIKGLECLEVLPDTPERTRHELALQLALGPALMAARGYAALEVEKAYVRARELCQQIGEPSQLLPVLVALWVVYIQRGNLQTAYELGEQCLTLAQRAQDSAFLLQAHTVLGVTLFFLGEFLPARMHLEQGSACYDSQKHHALAFLYYGLDPGVFSLSWLALTLWNLGYANQALERSYEGVTLAQRLSHPFSSAFALNWAAWLRQLRQEKQIVQEHAKAAIDLSMEQKFPFFLAWGRTVGGWARAAQGEQEEGITQMRQGLAGLRDTGAELWRPYHLTLLAETYGKAKQEEGELIMLTEALTIVQETGIRLVEAELYRLKGELVLQFGVRGQDKSGVRSPESEVTNPQSLTPNPQSEAEACFLKAIEIARRQSAKSLELRAVMSLSRLWQQQGKKEEARQMLVEIYGWFTEGFDTKDLQEAKVLLAELTD